MHVLLSIIRIIPLFPWRIAFYLNAPQIMAQMETLANACDVDVPVKT